MAICHIAGLPQRWPFEKFLSNGHIRFYICCACSDPLKPEQVIAFKINSYVQFALEFNVLGYSTLTKQ